MIKYPYQWHQWNNINCFQFIFSWYFLFFIFLLVSFSPAQGNNIYHILYYFLLESNWHQPFNKCWLFFLFVDNSFITVLMIQIVLFLFVIIIFVLHGFHIFYRIILISTRGIISIITWSICKFRTIIIFPVS